MKKFLKKLLWIIPIALGALILITVILAVLMLYTFTGPNIYVPALVYSDDGLRVIVPTINYDKSDIGTYLCVNIEIRDVQSKETLYQVQTYASDRMKWSVYWIDNNTFQLDSSDIGSYCWKENDGIWGETECP